MAQHVKVSIDEPWDAGEALGWPVLEGSLKTLEDGTGALDLQNKIEWESRSADKFIVRARHADDTLEKVRSADSILCNAWAADDPTFRFIFTITKRE